MNRHSSFAILGALALGLSGCDDAPTRSGVSTDPVTISSGYGSAVGGIGADVLDELTSVTSDDAVSVSTPQESTGTDDEEGDAIVALQAGDFDLSVIRADRLAMAGADSLAVLQTPFLVTSTEQADRIAADPIADELMAGLDDLGLVGLALVPGGLRHPFGYAGALVVPDDYAGRRFNVRPGSGVEAIVEGLGATPDNSIGPVRTEAAASGDLAGIEVSLQQFGAVDLPAVLTSNQTLYTKFDVVVARADAWSGLTGAQQEDLRDAAVAAGDQAIALRDTEESGLDRWCHTPGATSIQATDDQIELLEAKLAPVIDAATATPEARALADRLTELGAGTSAPAGMTCEASATPSDLEVVATGDQGVLDGKWRMEVLKEDLVAAGASSTDASLNAGVWTLDVSNGLATVQQPNDPDDCTWQFRFSGEQVSVDTGAMGNDACYGLIRGTYQRDGDTVSFVWTDERDYDVALDNAIWAHGLHRIQ